MLRLTVVGIGGSGKSTTTLRAIRELGRSRFVVKPGRPNIIASDGRIHNYLPADGAFFENLFARVDQIDTSHKNELEVAGIVSECTLKLPPDFSEPLYVKV